MKPGKILIVEDDLITAASMADSLEKRGYTTVISSTGEYALELLKSTRYDLILMDIHLDGKIDGITTARSINGLYSLPIIFITELFDDEIFKSASETSPKNYITKPFSDNTLVHAVALAIKNAEEGAKTNSKEFIVDAVFIPSGGASVKLSLGDILYIKAKGAYSEIYCEPADKQLNPACHLVSLSSNHVIEKLACPALIKVQKSYHVNIHKIEKIQGHSVYIHGAEISVAKECMNELKKRLLFFKH